MEFLTEVNTNTYSLDEDTMTKLKYISPKNLPPSFPVLTTAVTYLFLDKFNPAQWVWGVVITLVVIYWLIVIWGVINSDFIDVIGNRKGQ